MSCLAVRSSGGTFTGTQRGHFGRQIEILGPQHEEPLIDPRQSPVGQAETFDDLRDLLSRIGDGQARLLEQFATRGVRIGLARFAAAAGRGPEGGPGQWSVRIVEAEQQNPPLPVNNQPS